MTNEKLQKLLTLLRENGVSEYSAQNLAIKLHPQAYLRSPMIDNTIVEQPEDTRKREEEDMFYSTRFGGSSESRP